MPETSNESSCRVSKESQSEGEAESGGHMATTDMYAFVYVRTSTNSIIMASRTRSRSPASPRPQLNVTFLHRVSHISPDVSHISHVSHVSPASHVSQVLATHRLIGHDSTTLCTVGAY
ncbi:hypothetical protein OAO87_02375 [bacterium]|nr:hypothetical protein [bacterium]